MVLFAQFHRAALRFAEAAEGLKAMSNATEPLLTRNQIVEVARTELGIPITKSTIEKAAMNGTGPQPAARYGKAFLYERIVALNWARSLVTPIAA